MKKTIGSIESFTGGLFANTIVSVPGASNYYVGSVIAYNKTIKQKLGVDISDGIISAKTALSMALKGKEFLNVDYCVSFTGNAGPTTIENKPVGLVYIAINKDVYKLNLKGTRMEIMGKSVQFVLNKIKSIIN